MSNKDKAIKISIGSIFVFYILILLKKILLDFSSITKFFYANYIEWVILVVMNIIALIMVFGRENN